MKWLLVSLVCLSCFASLAVASSCNSCCWSLCCGGTVDFKGEVLYLRPSYCDLQYAVQDGRAYVPAPNPIVPPAANTEEFGPIGDIKSVGPRYEFGFRVGAGVTQKEYCLDARALYTRVHTNDHRSLFPSPADGGIWASELIGSDPNANVNQGEPLFIQVILFNPSDNTSLTEIAAKAFARAKFEYDSGNAQVGIRWCPHRDLWLRGHVGAHFVYLDHQFDVTYMGTLHPGEEAPSLFLSNQLYGYVRRAATAWGAGPHFGIEGIYQLFCCFGIGFHAGAGLIAGDRDLKYSQQYLTLSSLTPANEVDSRTWDVHSGHHFFTAPFFDARLGLNYLYHCGPCAYIAVEIGYEWINYVQMLPLGVRFREDKGIAVDECTDFNLDGVYLAVWVSF